MITAPDSYAELRMPAKDSPIDPRVYCRYAYAAKQRLHA
jgi:hypothetical protein